MSLRSDVAPSTVGVDVGPDRVAVEYLDGRTAVYRSERAAARGRVRCQPGKHVHVLVTDASETEGVMVYVNDRWTHEDVLESTGVGRVMLDDRDGAELFPGVSVSRDGHAIVVEVETGVVDGRVFVFEEDETGERAHEVVEADGTG